MRSNGHCTQYAVIGENTILDTIRLTDKEIIEKAKSKLGNYFKPTNVKSPIRFNRCPVCEAWTTVLGKLRKDIDCPAVKDELKELEK